MRITSLFKILLFSILIFMISCEMPLGESDDSATRAGKLKVFILAGQSNMEGKGGIEPKQSWIDKNGGKGTLRYMYNKDKQQYKYLVDSSGKWAERNDVWLVDVSKQGPLKANFRNTFGPELQFGIEMGNYYKNNNVLLIKTAWGGQSLAVNFRPPSSGGTVGPKYTEMLQMINNVLGNLKKYYPDYSGQGYEIVGFGWHQGWNDRVKEEFVDQYRTNCVNFINDIRKDLKLEKLPFVLANTGQGGRDVNEKAEKLMNEQMAVPKDSRLKVKDNVGAVETRDMYIDSADSPTGQTSHWNHNAKSYLQLSGEMAKMMIKILKEGGLHGNEPGDDPVPGDKYTVKVNNGSGGGTYDVGQVVTISANPAPSGQVFKKWKVISGNPQIDQVESPNATFKMPSGDVEITAKYETEPVTTDEYDLIVNDGSGDGSYFANKVVTISADTAPDGQVFDKWEIIHGNPQIKNTNSSTTTLTMPSGNVEISASYKDEEEEEIGCGDIQDLFNTNKDE